MADEERVEATEETKAPMSGKKKLIIISAIVVVQLVLVIALGQVLIKPKIAPADTTTADTDTNERGTIVTLEDITVNLNSGKRSRFLRLKIGLELKDDAGAVEIEERKPEIRDLVITSVSGRGVDQLISVEGKAQLKHELKERINAKLQKGDLMNVYFSDFVVQ